MAKHDEQLVKLIAEQVIAAMQSQGTPGQAAIHAPAGVCTGDYSKFAELQQPPRKQAPRSPQRDAVGVPPDALPALEGFITAHQLETAIKTAPAGIATLAASARLTPLAADFARQHPEKVRRVNQPSHNPSNRKQPAPAGAAPWLWWADEHCPAVQSLAAEHRDRLRPATAPRSDVGLVEVVGDLARQTADGRVQGGLLFVRSAARPVCYANRCKHLRAVVGTCAETVDEAVTELGANVLVIEYPYISPATMAELINRMLAQPPRLPANVARHLTDLHCR